MLSERLQGIVLGLGFASALAIGGHALADPAIGQPATAENPVIELQLEGLGDRTGVRTAPNGAVSVLEAARGSNAFIGFLLIAPDQKIGLHRDPTEEYLVVFQGGGTLTLNGEQHILKSGSAVFMAANAEVSYVNGREPTIALQVFAGPESADKYSTWTTEPQGKPEQSGDIEAMTNLDGIRTAEKAYHHEWDTFTSAGWTPPALGGREAIAFSGGGLESFLNLGWAADGLVRCRYKAEAKNGTSAAQDEVDLWAECDTDGDGQRAIYYANRAEKAKMVTPADVR